QKEEDPMIDKRNALRTTMAVALAVLGASLGGAALAQQKLVLKASDVHPEGYPTVAAIASMGKKLEAATSGRISIQIYPSMQLGGEKEAIEQAQVGALALARVSVGALGPVIDDLNVFNLPYLFRNTAHMNKVIDGPIGQELLEKITNNPKAGLVGLCWMDAGARTLDEHLIVPEILLMSRRVWDSLSPADQALVKKFSREAQMEERVLWNKYEKDAMDKARAAGITITEIADKKPFQAAVKPVWDKY